MEGGELSRAVVVDQPMVLSRKFLLREMLSSKGRELSTPLPPPPIPGLLFSPFLQPHGCRSHHRPSAGEQWSIP